TNGTAGGQAQPVSPGGLTVNLSHINCLRAHRVLRAGTARSLLVCAPTHTKLHGSIGPWGKEKSHAQRWEDSLVSLSRLDSVGSDTLSSGVWGNPLQVESGRHHDAAARFRFGLPRTASHGHSRDLLAIEGPEADERDNALRTHVT